MTDTTTKDLVKRKPKYVLGPMGFHCECHGEGRCPDEPERLTASAPVDGDLREKWQTIYDWFLNNCEETNPETGEVVEAYAREAFNALCDLNPRPALLPARTPEPDADVVERGAELLSRHLFATQSEREPEDWKDLAEIYRGVFRHAFLAAANLLRTRAKEPSNG